MLSPETPCISEDYLSNNSNEIKAEKAYTFTSNKNNVFNIIFKNYSNYILINGFLNNNSINYSIYEKKYNINDLKNNKYLSLCDTVDEMFNQIIFELEKNNKISLVENNKKIIFKIPVEHVKIKEITFTLEEKIKTEKELIEDLYQEINKLKVENNNIKEEFNKMKKDFDLIKSANKELNEKNLNLENQLKIFSDKLNILLNNQAKIIPEIKDKKENIITNEVNNKEKVYNNIIYYTNEEKDLRNIYNDSDVFERNTNGAFVLCLSLDSFNLAIQEIIKEYKNDKNIKFNLILGEINIQIIQGILKENNELSQIIQNICIYSKNPEKYYNINTITIFDIYKNREDIINFIIIFSSTNIKPFPQTKLITYQDYLDKYKEFHLKISQFYGDLSPQSFKYYFGKLKIVIEEEEKEKKLRKNRDLLLQSFSKFEIKKDLNKVDELIINEWTKDTFWNDFNKWLYNLDMNNFEPKAYFASRFIYSLNSYAHRKDKYCTKNEKILYRGVKKSYINLLPYERAKGKIILLSSIISSFEEEKMINPYAKYKNAKSQFSTIFYIKNIYKKNYIPNGIIITDVSEFKYEKECLFQPFSFFYVKDIEIDLNKYVAKIYLETIGKTEILEEQLKQGKEIEYNQKENIMQVKKK